MPANPDPSAGRVKRVLVIDYSQTGQLRRVTERILEPLRADPAISVHVEQLRPQPDYPCPWPFLRFFDAFPESAHGVPPALAPLSLTGEEEFDLVILPWQVWFLAPSLPITGFLKHPVAQRLLRGKPVVAVVACRNMWMLAFEKLQAMLHASGARLLDHVVLTDPGPTLATFVTTPVWLLSGRKKGFWGMPDAGLSEAQIAGTRRFGLALRDALAHDREQGSAPLLAGLGAARADARLYVSEKAGTRSFFLWGKLLRAVGPPGAALRKPLLALYFLFLLTLIVTFVPLSLMLQALLRPLFRDRLSRIQAHFELPSGSAGERYHLYGD
ncbi:dialkylrecorsinol condensing enzyme [Variovorax sp.]|uniref:dialkylrecorsinol condensing enzyme n=1 Tax=Variovorax sp. TaxID=1871043 RepID=UPI002D72B33A|nr:dialkylrecorsinol condensing enzyme [Variovorax sp.]HYP85093.1 dialkylresorcinol condensing enzyme [Variovorax sp.]